MHPVLILGGTAEARALAGELADRGVPVISSLAGRVTNPRLPRGAVRVGGFGGPDGLAAWLSDHATRAVVDATHPFAARISASAVTAAGVTGIPLLRLQRPGWRPGPGDDWRWADSLPHAARLLETLGTRVFLTTGRQDAGVFAELAGRWFLLRCVDPPVAPLPAHTEVLLDRGPYTVDGESALLRDHRIDVLVSKDSGGDYTSAKLHAARALGIPVVMVRRPTGPNVSTVDSVAAAARWVLERM